MAELLGKERALAEAATGFEAWQLFVADMQEAGRADERGPEGWTLAELTGHIARWEGWAAGRLTAPGDQAPALTEEDMHQMNAQWAEANRGLRLEEAQALHEASHEALREAAASIPQERWDVRVESTFKFNTWAHYQEHLEAQSPPTT